MTNKYLLPITLIFLSLGLMQSDIPTFIGSDDIRSVTLGMVGETNPNHILTKGKLPNGTERLSDVDRNLDQTANPDLSTTTDISYPIFYLSNGDIFLLETLSGSPKQITNGHEYVYMNISSDGNSAIALPDGSRDVPLDFIDLNSGNVTRISNVFFFRTYPVLSPQGDKILFLGSGGSISTQITDRDGNLIAELPFWAEFPYWSSDGSKLFYFRTSEERGLYEYSFINHTIKLLDSFSNFSGPYPFITPEEVHYHENMEWLSMWNYDNEGSGILDIFKISTEHIRPDFPGRSQWTSSPMGEWSPDGSTLIFIASRFPYNTDGELYAYNVYEKALDKISDQGGLNPHWSPDGSKIVYTTYGGAVEIIDLKSLAVQKLLDDAPSSVLQEFTSFGGTILGRWADWGFDSQWSPDGKWITFQYPNGYYIIDVQNNQHQWIEDGNSPIWIKQALKEQVTEGWIAFIGTDGNVWMIQDDGINLQQITTNAGTMETVDSNPLAYRNLKWSPDGTKLGFTQETSIQVSTGEITYADYSNNILVYDLGSGVTEKVLTYEETNGGFDWFGDGNHLIYDRSRTATTDGGWCPSGYSEYDGLYVLNLETGESQRVIPTPNASPLSAPIASPTGSAVIFEYVPNPATPIFFPNEPLFHASVEKPNEFHPLTDMLANCDWSPDGSQLVCASWTENCIQAKSCQLSLFSADGLKVDQLSGAPRSYDYRPSWSPDGQLIAFNVASDRAFGDGPCGGTSLPWSDNPDVNILSLIDPERQKITSGFLDGWSPDGKRLLIERGGGFSKDRQITIFEIASGQETILAQGIQATWQPNPRTDPPDAITSLTIFPYEDKESRGTIRLVWEESEADHQSGLLVSEYEVRFSNQIITDDNWEDAMVVSGQPAPKNTSSLRSWIIEDTRITINQRWYFAIKSRTETSDWSKLSNVPSLLDSGFRPSIDGYHFPNGPDGLIDVTGWEYYPIYPANEDFTLDDVITMFGEEQVCLPVKDLFQNCIFKPGIPTLHKIINYGTWGGHCVGMATTSLNIYLDPQGAKSLNPNIKFVYDDLSLANSRRIITYFFAMQLANPVLQYTTEKQYTHSPRDTLNSIYQGFLNNDPVILVFRQNLESLGHGVTPYMLSENGDGTWTVFNYDNNSPGKLSYISIDPEKNHWTGGDQTYNASNYLLYTIPLHLFTGKLTPPTMQQILAYSLTDDILRIQNKIGQRIGFINNLFVNEIPGASIGSLIGGIEALQPFYLLPPDQTYTITMSGLESTRDTDINFALIGPRFALTLDNLELKPSSQDILELNPEDSLLKYQANEARDINLLYEFDENLVIYRVLVKSINIDPGHTFEMRFDTEKRNIIIKSATVDGSNYDINISRLGHTGKFKFDLSNVEMSGGESQIYDLAQWEEDGEMILRIDEDDDGKYDEEINLSKQSNIAGSTTTFWDSLWLGPSLIGLGFIILGLGIFGWVRTRQS